MSEIRMSGRKQLNLRFVRGFLEASLTWTTSLTGRVRCSPIIIPVDMIVDRIGFYISVSAGNVRAGIYKDNGNTPLGGALIADSGSVACPVAGKGELTIADTFLAKALYWICFEHDNALLQIAEQPGQAQWQGGTLEMWRYALAYGAFTNPCPAINQADDAIGCYLRVKQTF